MPEDLVLEQLRAIRASIGDLREDGKETRERVGHLEHQLAGVYGQYASISDRLDRVYALLERINKRLELVD